MNISVLSSLMVSLIAGSLFVQINTTSRQSLAEKLSEPEITCKEALQNANKIKVGMAASEVQKLLGSPRRIENGAWIYDFFDCSPPPEAGTQSVVGLAITFEDKVVNKIDYATICATGPGD